MSIEAMKQALDALEKLSDAADGFNVSGVYFNEQLWEKECLDKSFAAITSLRQAIEQAEKQKPVLWERRPDGKIGPTVWAGVDFDIKTTFSQVEKQEPIAWQWLNTAHFRKKLPKDAEKGAWNPLYTTPQPQREFVGLTEEEIALVCAECAASAHNWNDISFARAIEKALKEKNSLKD